MGLIRLLLAVAVITAHTTRIRGFRFIDSAVAVQTFFIISGFYMALVLNTKYAAGRGSYRLFMGNRLLRLMPDYWIVLMLTVTLGFAGLLPGTFYVRGAANGDHWVRPWSNWIIHANMMPAGTTAALAMPNLTLFGMDALMFTKVTPQATIAPSRTIAGAPLPSYEFMFVPQAWTLGLELLFYLIAPLIVRRRIPWLVAIMSASLALRAFLYWGLSLNQDPWTYRFFPTELAFFVMGAIAYRVYENVVSSAGSQAVHRVGWVGVTFIVLAVLQGGRIPSSLTYVTLYFAAVATVLPFVFLLTKRVAFDRFIGDLSYPTYIGHLLIQAVLIAWGLHASGLITSIATIVASTIMLLAVDQPIDRIRQRRARDFVREVPTIPSLVSPAE